MKMSIQLWAKWKCFFAILWVRLCNDHIQDCDFICWPIQTMIVWWLIWTSWLYNNMLIFRSSFSNETHILTYSNSITFFWKHWLSKISTLNFEGCFFYFWSICKNIHMQSAFYITQAWVTGQIKLILILFYY